MSISSAPIDEMERAFGENCFDLAVDLGIAEAHALLQCRMRPLVASAICRVVGTTQRESSVMLDARPPG